MAPISKAIKLVGAKTLAEGCGVSVQAVYKWAGTQVPADKCPKIERMTDGAITCEMLRTDIDWAGHRTSKAA
ncbi:MAG: Cro/CI family transcriptional regulator [Methylococcaceae bacterium]|nr:Cro/CI family transcriptional regulator [Methylococcaceae bacterium]